MSILVWDLRCPSLGFKLSNLEGFLAPKPASAFELLLDPSFGPKKCFRSEEFYESRARSNSFKTKTRNLIPKFS